MDFFLNKTKYVIALMTSAARVANAAPGTPIANENIKIGSSMALKMLANNETLTGVSVSNIPRKAEKPTSEINDGRNAKDRISR
mmetsp:Transcript_16364/g.46994  ORF Transcript_16364/g.46994 Transcript_16364/m.46994 type:complete len:84 (+) Transcript_16364:921-1172(+)